MKTKRLAWIPLAFLGLWVALAVRDRAARVSAQYERGLSESAARKNARAKEVIERKLYEALYAPTPEQLEIQAQAMLDHLEQVKAGTDGGFLPDGRCSFCLSDLRYSCWYCGKTQGKLDGSSARLISGVAGRLTR